GHAAAVGVAHQRVGLVTRHRHTVGTQALLAVAQHVTIGVGVARIGQRGGLLQVGEAVAIGVDEQRVAAEVEHLFGVGLAVEIGVGQRGVAAVYGDLHTVVQAVAV